MSADFYAWDLDRLLEAHEHPSEISPSLRDEFRLFLIKKLCDRIAKLERRDRKLISRLSKKARARFNAATK